MSELSKEDYANVFGSFMETALDFTEHMNNESEKKDKEIEKLTEELKNTKSRLKNVNNKKEHYKDVLRQIIHYCNYLRNDHKYSLNNGHIRKIKKICEREVGADDKI